MHTVAGIKKELNQLFTDKTATILGKLGKPEPGIKPFFDIEISIQEILALSEECLIKDVARKEFRKHYNKTKKQWHVTNRKGWGLEDKKENFEDWFKTHVPRKSCVYVLWNKKKECIYVGRTQTGNARIISHLFNRRFSNIKRVDVYATPNKRELPKLECLASHRFGPLKNKIRASKKKYAKRCPICVTLKDVESEIKSIFG